MGSSSALNGEDPVDLCSQSQSPCKNVVDKCLIDLNFSIFPLTVRFGMLFAIRRFFNPVVGPVTICIPAYNASAFIAETVQSVLDQTYPDIQVLISVDAGHDDTETVIQQNFKDSRIHMYVQSQRLGWVANTNFLLAAVQSPYFCILPHDDIIAPGFVSRLLIRLQRSPRAVAAYCDIRCFGASNQKIVQPSVAGSRMKRITNYLCNHYNAVVM